MKEETMDINYFLEKNCGIKNDNMNNDFISKNKNREFVEKKIILDEKCLEKNKRMMEIYNNFKEEKYIAINDKNKFNYYSKKFSLDLTNSNDILKKKKKDLISFTEKIFLFNYFYFYVLEGDDKLDFRNINFSDKIKNTEEILKNHEKYFIDKIEKIKDKYLLKIKEKEAFILNKKNKNELINKAKEIKKLNNKIVFENNFEREKYYDIIDKKKSELRKLQEEISDYPNIEKKINHDLDEYIKKLENYINNIKDIKMFPMNEYEEFIYFVNEKQNKIKNYDKIQENFISLLNIYRLIIFLLFFYNILMYI